MRTGRDNAKDFIARVESQADQRMVTAYDSKWPWMANQEWREYVLQNISVTLLNDCKFSAPDSLDGWTFVGYGLMPAIRHRPLDGQE